MNENGGRIDKHNWNSFYSVRHEYSQGAVAIAVLAGQPRRMRRSGPDFQMVLSCSRAVESHLEHATGLRPAVREVVAKDFKQTPDTIVLASSLRK